MDALDSPFEPDKSGRLIVHCSHHKAGTVWFGRVLRKVARVYGLNFQNQKKDELSSETDILFQQHSAVDVSTLPDYVGSHIIRDPRDTVISGYFYHLWTDEEWANIPQKKFDGLSCRQYLNQLNQHDGLLAEIRRMNTLTAPMVSWDYNDPGILEIKYEDIIENEQFYFQKLFKHYGFHEKAIKKACQIADSCSFKNAVKREKDDSKSGSHLRSGKPGEWRQLFSNEHKECFKHLYPGLIPKLGYEKNDNW